MLLAALAIECLGNGLFAALTAIVSEPRERARIALAREHGLDNCHPRHTGEVADDMLQLDIHLGAGLLHMLDMLPRIGQEHGPLLQITAQHADLVGRPKRTGQEAERVEALYPLAIVDVTLRPAPDLLDLLRIHEEHLEAARLQPPPPSIPKSTFGLDV